MGEIVKRVLSNPCGMLNVNSIARDLGGSKITISNYPKILRSIINS